MAAQVLGGEPVSAWPPSWPRRPRAIPSSSSSWRWTCANGAWCCRPPRAPASRWRTAPGGSRSAGQRQRRAGGASRPADGAGEGRGPNTRLCWAMSLRSICCRRCSALTSSCWARSGAPRPNLGLVKRADRGALSLPAQPAAGCRLCMQIQARLRELHGLAGAAIEAVHGTDLAPHAAALAYHWSVAGHGPKEARYAALAGAQALNASAFTRRRPLFPARVGPGGRRRGRRGGCLRAS